MKHWLLYCCFFLAFTAVSQVNWQSVDSIQTSFKEEPKPILLFIHTDWCKICKMQEAGLFSDDSLSALINDQFYALKLNAESTKDLSFFGRTYKGATANRYHKMARYFGEHNKQLSFPTTLVLNSKFEVILKRSSLISKEEFNELMDGFAK